MRFALVAALLLASSGLPPASAADTKAMRIALSNNYAGNSWRQTMLRSWSKAADQAIGDGLVAEAPALTTSENTAADQAVQIGDLIGQGYDAIVIDAASPTALNDAVKQACTAGIVVVSFDGTVSEPCAYRIGIDFRALGAMQVDYFRKRGLKGKILEIRGLAGVSVDDDIHEGMNAALSEGDDLQVAGSVHGNWTETVAQAEVARILPRLPDVVAVTTQGGDGFGAAEAFAAAGRAEPVIFLGNRGDELRWWKGQHEASGYETMSASIAPGISGFALWIAQKVLAGESVLHDITVPTVVVTQATLDDALRRTEPDGVTNVDYSRQDVTDFLAKAGG